MGILIFSSVYAQKVLKINNMTDNYKIEIGMIETRKLNQYQQPFTTISSWPNSFVTLMPGETYILSNSTSVTKFPFISNSGSLPSINSWAGSSGLGTISSNTAFNSYGDDFVFSLLKFGIRDMNNTWIDGSNIGCNPLNLLMRSEAWHTEDGSVEVILISHFIPSNNVYNWEITVNEN